MSEHSNKSQMNKELRWPDVSCDASISISPSNDKALAQFTDKQLRDELKRRANIRKAAKGTVLRCRTCKFCIQGYHSPRTSWYGYETTVCKMKPKLQATLRSGRDCYYATSMSQKACEKYEPK